jgi:D-alanine transaminase
MILCIDGRCIFLEDHLARLKQSLASIKLIPDFKEKNLEDEINRIANINDAPFQAIYVQISRGVQLIRNHLPEENLSPTVFITSIKIDDPSDRHKGISALLKDDERWLKTDIKSTSLLANVLGKIEADSKGHDEVILHKDGFLNEGAVSNLFLFINDDLYTPSLDANILPGVTRAKLIYLAEANNINVIQRIIPLSEIDNAQEVFMSSTTKGVIPVVRIIGSKFDTDKSGDLTSRLREIYLQEIYQT